MDRSLNRRDFKEQKRKDPKKCGSLQVLKIHFINLSLFYVCC